MKNKSLRIFLIIALLLFTLVSMGCSKDKKTEKEKVDNTEKENITLELLGFESKEEINGTKFLMKNTFGKMQINDDEKYLTQGKGSLKVEIQGRYSEPLLHPYLQFDCLNTTVATADFSEFKNISFDVYNNEDTELHIRFYMTVGKESGAYEDTNKVTYTLKPHEWTTCTYDISMLSSFSYYDFANVRYLYFEFMEHKESKEDTLNNLYLDNLLGTYYAAGETVPEIEYDFMEGITFENSEQANLIYGASADETRTDVERVAYADEGIPVTSEYGEYGMRGDVTGSIWPRFRIRLGEELTEDMMLTAMIYVKKEVFPGDTYSMVNGTLEETVFNEWIEVRLTVSAGKDMAEIVFNFDDFSDPIVGNRRFGYQTIAIYLDNIKLSPILPDPDPEGDFYQGIGFENELNTYFFTGQKLESKEWCDAVIKRVAYGKEGITAPSNGGSYALKLSNVSFPCPYFRINFGKEIPAGTVITFDAYAVAPSATASLTRFEFFSSDGYVSLGDFSLEEWTEIEFTLPEATDAINLFWNYEITGGTNQSAVYVDNFKLTPAAEPEGDFYAGVDFEIAGNAGMFKGWEVAKEEWADATIKRVAYTKADIEALKDGGKYALKLSHLYYPCPRVTINFGEKVPAGTTLTFMAYGVVDGAPDGAKTLFAPKAKTTVATSSNEFELGKWTEVKITIKEATESIDLYWNFEIAKGEANGQGEVYVDNFKLTPPVKPEGDFYKGVDFEIAGNAGLFTGWKVSGVEWADATIERVPYASTGITALADGGTYALKLSHTAHPCPRFVIDFGEVVPAGTTLTFMAYATVEEAVHDARFDLTETQGKQYAYSQVGAWQEILFTLSEDTQTIKLEFNYEATGTTRKVGAVYVDNFKLTPPVKPEGDFYEGVDFEITGNAGLFTGWKVSGVEWADATIERVPYTSAGIAALTDGGTYVLKLSHTTHTCPRFAIDFGEVVPAGTTLTFMAYATVEDAVYEARFDLKESTGTQYAYLAVGEWKEISFTLKEDAQIIKLEFNYEATGTTQKAGAVYVDNVKFYKTDFNEGVGFEKEIDASTFTGWGNPTWADATIERVTYTSAKIAATEGGGAYALKLSNTEYQYPRFAIDFGEVVPAGTTITFMAYATVEDAVYEARFDLTESTQSPNKQYAYFEVGVWKEISFTLREDAQTIKLEFNYNTTGTAQLAGAVYVDNFKLINK